MTYENRTGLLFQQCTSCSAGYVPYQHYCIPNGCEGSTYNVTTGLCTACSAFGYILSEDRRSCIVANCEIPVLPDQCQKCKVGFRNFTGLCIANNCSTFDETFCTSCLDGFTLVN